MTANPAARPAAIRRIAVYCGSACGSEAHYVRTAREIGALLAAHKIGIVYGGAHIGLMGAVADAALERGGEVIGVIPRSLQQRELAHSALTAMHITESMHERKALMMQLCDAFLILPGGLGTLDEMFEAWTWSSLGIHSKRLLLLNVTGYFDGLLNFLDHASSAGFVKSELRSRLEVFGSTAQLGAAISQTITNN